MSVESRAALSHELIPESRAEQRAEADVDLDSPELASSVRQGEPAALRAVVRAYLPQILRAARGAGSSAEQADEVAQEVFATFVETASRFEGRSHVRTWLFGILYRKLQEQRRHRERDERFDDIDQVVESRFSASGRWARPPLPTDARVDRRETREKIQDCLAASPTQQRMAFLLREVEGFSTEEICNILDVSRTNLGVMLYRIRNRLRECLESKGIEGPA